MCSAARPIRSAPRTSPRGSGLETTGITLPLTRVADKVRTPEREPSPILVGRSNALVERLVKIGKARLDDLQPGEGAVQIVPKAFGNATATVVAGADAAGTDAAAIVSRAPRAVRLGQRARLDCRSATSRCR